VICGHSLERASGGPAAESVLESLELLGQRFDVALVDRPEWPLEKVGRDEPLGVLRKTGS
jgi:hypothetical protein